MKSTKLSIVNSVVAGILICAMLAACGAVEKQSAAFSDGGSNLPVSEDMTESAAPETQPAPSEEMPETEAPVTEAEASEPSEISEPEPAEPEPEPEEEPVFSESDAASIVVDTAAGLLGYPYKSGGSSPDEGFDSSGFTYYCMRAAGVDFPRQISDQLESGIKIAYQDLMPGDAVYFSHEPGEEAGFCGIYLGGGLIIYSPVPDEFVKTSNITTNYWTSRFVTGIRPEN